jgi:hypothetical protein
MENNNNPPEEIQDDHDEEMGDQEESVEESLENGGFQAMNSDDEDSGEGPNKRAKTKGFFSQFSSTKEDKEEKRKKEVKLKINELLCRNPGLKPRDSLPLMNLFESYSLDQLENIYTNCLNDLIEHRGMSASSVLIKCLSYVADVLLPGFSDECLKDIELRKDLEYEAIDLLRYFGTRVNILFRLGDNALTAFEKNRYNYRYINPRDEIKILQETESPYVKVVELPTDIAKTTKEKEVNGDGTSNAQTKKRGRPPTVTPNSTIIEI